MTLPHPSCRCMCWCWRQSCVPRCLRQCSPCCLRAPPSSAPFCTWRSCIRWMNHGWRVLRVLARSGPLQASRCMSDSGSSQQIFQLFSPSRELRRQPPMLMPTDAQFACRQPGLDRVVEAVTPQSCQEDYSYERLENLGDAIIKYSTCLSLFSSFPSAHEGAPPLFNPARYLKMPHPHPCICGGVCMCKCLI